MSNKPFSWYAITLVCALMPRVAGSEDNFTVTARVTTVPPHSGFSALLDYKVELETILKQDDDRGETRGDFTWGDQHRHADHLRQVEQRQNAVQLRLLI